MVSPMPPREAVRYYRQCRQVCVQMCVCSAKSVWEREGGERRGDREDDGFGEVDLTGGRR